MLCKRPDSVSEQTNSRQGDKAGKRCIGIGGGIRKTIEMWWLKTCVQFQKGLVGGKGRKALDSQRQVEDDFGETISNNDIC